MDHRPTFQRLGILDGAMVTHENALPSAFLREKGVNQKVGGI
jgi:hypothetical protein